MTINKAKASAYNTVTTAAVYDYMRQYLAKISRMIEPEEDGDRKRIQGKTSTDGRSKPPDIKNLCGRIRNGCKAAEICY